MDCGKGIEIQAAIVLNFPRVPVVAPSQIAALRRSNDTIKGEMVWRIGGTMYLEGSCHCGSVQFSLETQTPYPYQHCYCTICRKTQGGSGAAVNIMGWADTLEVTGEDHITVYHAKIDGVESDVERRFCSKCGSALWVYHDRWPELVHPFASAIDTDLPKPEEVVHMMLEFRAKWIDVPEGDGNLHFDGYPDRSIEVWHERQGLMSK